MDISRKKFAENAVFDLYFSKIKIKDNIVDDYLTVAPKNVVANGITGISILPVVDGKIALLRLYRPCVDATVWEIPRGFVQPDENASDSAIRELEEELSTTITSLKLHSLGFFMPEAGILDARVELFYAVLSLEGELQVSDELGHLKYELFSIDEIKNMIANSEIQDPSLIISMCRYGLVGS